jgi:hypothetical protein
MISTFELPWQAFHAAFHCSIDFSQLPVLCPGHMPSVLLCQKLRLRGEVQAINQQLQLLQPLCACLRFSSIWRA